MGVFEDIGLLFAFAEPPPYRTRFSHLSTTAATTATVMAITENGVGRTSFDGFMAQYDGTRGVLEGRAFFITTEDGICHS